MTRYPHIFFDLDHTLWDFKSNSRNALQSLHIDFIVPRNPRVAFNSFYYTYMDINDIWWQQYRAGKVVKEQLRTGRFRDALQRLGIIDELLTETLATEYIARSPYQKALFPGAIETLQWLHARGHRMHIITNGFEEVQHIKIQESGLSGFFEHVITSEAIDARKPDPRIFAHAFSLTGSNASEALMIGDSLEADIRGAARAGMDQVFFNPDGLKHDARPTYEVRELTELRLLIAE